MQQLHKHFDVSVTFSRKKNHFSFETIRNTNANIRKAQLVHDDELFKKLNKFIWEFRTLYNSKSYRLFSFWDKSDGQETLVVATHGILKKTQKTPLKEIKKADEIRKQYLKNKTKKK